MKFTKTTTIIILSIIFLSLIFSGYAYQKIEDERIVTHWNAQGEADNYDSKIKGVLLFPSMLVIIFILFSIFPRINFFKLYIETFRKQYNSLTLIVILFLLFLHLLMMLLNINTNINILDFLNLS